jgi:hypothetical protein
VCGVRIVAMATNMTVTLPPYWPWSCLFLCRTDCCNIAVV